MNSSVFIINLFSFSFYALIYVGNIYIGQRTAPISFFYAVTEANFYLWTHPRDKKNVFEDIRARKTNENCVNTSFL